MVTKPNTIVISDAVWKLMVKNKITHGHIQANGETAFPLDTLYALYKADFPETANEDKFNSAIADIVRGKKGYKSLGNYDGKGEKDYFIILNPKTFKPSVKVKTIKR